MASSAQPAVSVAVEPDKSPASLSSTPAAPVPLLKQRRLLAISILSLGSIVCFGVALGTSSWMYVEYPIHTLDPIYLSHFCVSDTVILFCCLRTQNSHYDETVSSVTTRYRSGLVRECSKSFSSVAGVREFPELCRFLPFYCKPDETSCNQFRTVQAMAIICFVLSIATSWSMFVVTYRGIGLGVPSQEMCPAFHVTMYIISSLTGKRRMTAFFSSLLLRTSSGWVGHAIYSARFVVCACLYSDVRIYWNRDICSSDGFTTEI